MKDLSDDPVKLSRALNSVDAQIAKTTKAIETLQDKMKSEKEGSDAFTAAKASLETYMKLLDDLKQKQATVMDRIKNPPPVPQAEPQKAEPSGYKSSWLDTNAWSRGLDKVEGKMSNLRAYASALKSEFQSFSGGAIKAITSAFNGLASAAKTAWSAIKKVWSIVGKIPTGIGKALASPFTNLANSAKNSFAKVKHGISALGRIAMYRALRTAIKEVAQAFKEGLEWAYKFSSGIKGEGNRFAQAMDSMKTAGNTMTAQLGSAFISLLTAIAPIVNSIIALITRLADALSQLFAAFTGSRYLKAETVSAKFADNMKKGGGAAKEWKNQLMGFDVINKLNEPSSGGGGGSAGVDPKNMFKDSKINENIKKFVDDLKAAISAGDWKTVGTMLGNKINELLPTKEQWSKWGEKLGYALNGAITSLFHFLNTVDFKGLGEGIATFINDALAQIDASTWGATLMRLFTVGLDFLISFLTTLDWGQLGRKIGEFLRGAFDNASEWLDSQDWSQLGTDLWNKFKALIEGIDFEALAKSFFTFLGKAFKAAINFLDSFFDESMSKVDEYFKGKTEEAGGNAWKGFLLGIKDAAIGVYNWIKTNIVDPFIQAFTGQLGINSPSTVFKGFGEDIIQGLWNGISDKWNSFISFFEGLWNNLKRWWQGLSLGTFHIPVPHFDWTYTQASGIIAQALEFVGLPATIPHLNISWYAQGGFPEDGLFMANHGELVGEFSNGKTAVANNQQITEGISRAVYEAFMEAFSVAGGNNNDRDIVIMMDGKEIARTTTKYQTQFARAAG